MDLKHHMKIKDELTEEPKLTEEDKLFFDSLVKQIKFVPEENTAVKKRVNFLKIFTPVISVAVAMAITFTCLFATRNVGEITYKEENILNKEVTFIEMLAEINYFDLSQLETITFDTHLYYDSKSNDKLFYDIKAVQEFTIINIIIVINKNFNYNFGTVEEITNKNLDYYTLNYYTETDRTGVQINYKGWIQVETEILYFDYTQIPALGDEAFFESIQQIIQLK